MGRLARLACSVALLLLALAPAASAATKKPHFYKLGVGEGPPVTDGKRDVAFSVGGSSIAFYDFGVKAPSERLIGAPPCDEASAHPYPSSLDAVGNGEILWECASVLSGPLLEHVTSGQVTQVPELPPKLSGDVGEVWGSSVGNQWISTRVKDHGGYFLAFFNPDTSAWRGEPTSARRYPNLDDPALGETMCRPLRRSPAPEDLEVNPLFAPYFYERPFGVATRRMNLGNGLFDAVITVQRCASHRASVVARCDSYCDDIQFSNGLITWVDGHALRAFAPRTGKRFAWRTSGFQTGIEETVPGTWFGHTRQRLIAYIPSLTTTSQSNVWAARMPRR